MIASALLAECPLMACWNGKDVVPPAGLATSKIAGMRLSWSTG